MCVCADSFALSDDWKIGQSASREREASLAGKLNLPRSAPAARSSEMWGEDQGGKLGDVLLAGSQTLSLVEASSKKREHPSLWITHTHTPQQPGVLTAGAASEAGVLPLALSPA